MEKLKSNKPTKMWQLFKKFNRNRHQQEIWKISNGSSIYKNYLQKNLSYKKTHLDIKKKRFKTFPTILNSPKSRFYETLEEN